MEADSEAKWDNLSMRVVDCLTPVGFGQRGLIVAPPRRVRPCLRKAWQILFRKLSGLSPNYPSN